MLPSGVQMLPLLWLLLWMPKLGLSSTPIPEDVTTGLVHEDTSSLYNRAGDRVDNETTEEEPETGNDYNDKDVTRVLMLDSTNEIYKQFRKSRHSVYMVFNTTELQKAVPDPSSLYRADLLIHKLKQHQEQHVMLFEKYRRNSWHYLSHRLLAPSDTAEWIAFNVTDAVRQWLNYRGPIEVFRLRGVSLGEKEDNVLHMDIGGITPNGHNEHPDNENRNRPFLLFLTSRLKQAQRMNSSQ
ncbi:transforming growth factor beta-1 proprotein-like [Ochotona curzoniae]|uniref:transforming growth factor beta-1 proprotein-like n=1 Tax=Ochotona curzoniae TaxID=130825 RepID=UPI001B34ED69|nr:transforming growth factor beta-1 proprotein-like [Ochotona curzoniae]